MKIDKLIRELFWPLSECYCPRREKETAFFGLISVSQRHEFKINWVEPWGVNRWMFFGSCRYCKCREQSGGHNDSIAVRIVDQTPCPKTVVHGSELIGICSTTDCNCWKREIIKRLEL